MSGLFGPPPPPSPESLSSPSSSSDRDAPAGIEDEPVPAYVRDRSSVEAVDAGRGRESWAAGRARWWWAGVAVALVALGRADRAAGSLPRPASSVTLLGAAPVTDTRIEDEQCRRAAAAASAVAARPASVAGERVRTGESRALKRISCRRGGSCRGAVRIADAAALGFDVPVHLRRRTVHAGSVRR